MEFWDGRLELVGYDLALNQRRRRRTAPPHGTESPDGGGRSPPDGLRVVVQLRVDGQMPRELARRSADPHVLW